MSSNSNGAQATLELHDGTGLRVVNAKFEGEEEFSWDIFAGFDSLLVLTYSASIKAVVRMLDKYSFNSFECIFGYEGILGNFMDILAFQKVVLGDTCAAIRGLKDERARYVLEQVHAGRVNFRVVKQHIAHAKLYLLSNDDGRTRVIIGSANLSERAFSGKQAETLVKFDNDEQAWSHYTRMFNEIRNSSSNEIPLTEDRISMSKIPISETPVMADTSSTLVIESPADEGLESTMPVQVSRVEKVAAALRPRISVAMPPIRNGTQRITPEVKKDISRIHLVKSAEEVNNRYFSLDRKKRSAWLSDKPFPLEWDDESVMTDATLLLDYFTSYEGAFEGNVQRLQRDYFTLMAWLYFSPFICDMRRLSLLRDTDIIRFPSFAIMFGKSNCGKTSLADTLLTSMLGYAPTVEKQSFTTTRLQGLQDSYKRFPVMFDDIGRRAFNLHGKEMIKNEMSPPVEEHPGFLLSMNAEPQSFPDEVVKRSMMIYTATALPPHDEELRQRLQGKIQEIRRKFTGHLYRRYLTEIMNQLDAEPLPEDWLAMSSRILSDIISNATGGSTPNWCRPITWLEYAEKRYDRVKNRLDSLLRPSAHAKSEGAVLNGWMFDGAKVIVWEQRDAWGRKGFDWDDVPSTLIDEEASGAGRTALYRDSVEKFIGRRLRPSARWWMPWTSA